MERLIDTAARDGHRPGPSYAGATTSATAAATRRIGHELQFGRVHHHPRQGAGRGRPSTSARESATRGELRGRIGQYLEVTGPPARYGSASRRTAPSPCWRHPRLRPGPRHAVRPGAGRRLRTPGHPTSACCRRSDSDQLKVGGGTVASKWRWSRPGLPRGRRQADRPGQEDRRPRRSRPRSSTSSSRTVASHRHRPQRHHSRLQRSKAARRSRSRSTSATSRTIRRSHSPMVAPRRRDRIDRDTSGSRSCAISWSTTSAPSSIRC